MPSSEQPAPAKPEKPFGHDIEFWKLKKGAPNNLPRSINPHHYEQADLHRVGPPSAARRAMRLSCSSAEEISLKPLTREQYVRAFGWGRM